MHSLVGEAEGAEEAEGAKTPENVGGKESRRGRGEWR